jgi:hypothetical protein
MKKIFMVLSLLTMVACKDVVYLTGPTITKTDTLVVTNGLQNVNLTVNWSKFTTGGSKLMSNLMANAVSDSGLTITHVGARLVYPKNNAVFTQSVVKDTGSTKLITLQVPSTDTAHLYIVAVHESGGVRKALKMGVKRNISIPTNGTINLTLDSLTLIDTDWMVEDTTATVTGDTIRVSRSNTLTSSLVRIKVRDQYDSTANMVLWTNLSIRFFGTGNIVHGNTTGWRNFDIYVPNRGTSTSVDTFWPYVTGSMFNLNGDYLIGKQGVIKTTWQ